MAIDKENTVQIAKYRERTFSFRPVWPMANPLPSITVQRERVPLDADGNKMGDSTFKDDSINAAKIAGSTYTRPDGSTFNGAQTIADVSLILDVECVDFFTPPAE